MGDTARPQCSKLCCHTAFFSSHCPPFPKPRPPFRGEFPSAYGEQISIKPGTVPEERSDTARRVVLSPIILLLGIPHPPSPRSCPPSQTRKTAPTPRAPSRYTGGCTIQHYKLMRATYPAAYLPCMAGNSSYSPPGSYSSRSCICCT